ncbi:hypothetical protein [Lysinibacillus sphaericus]|uniref:Uncharacterized protein n=1 Tax=Lysinibacillus sphaericus OT4b.31 TaxID=1285586 RepID=R7Z8Q0_LYSSH|nr:hypothetical protein [Lysinibacillus sphaericus]EON70404.1 hypothetical protein H131_21872 [Lysinibacillus sphaericus OT4b.31]
MNFKETLEADLSSVFFNVDEMAAEHVLDGNELTLVVVDSSLEEINGFSRDQLDASQEMFKSYKTIYVKSSEFYIPKIDSLLELDGEEYYVEQAGEEMGIIRILVYANES